MKYIKNELRNRIGDQLMNDCLVVYIEKDVALIMKLLCNDFKIWKLIEGNCKFYVFAYFFLLLLSIYKIFILLDCVIYACWGTPWKNFLDSPLITTTNHHQKPQTKNHHRPTRSAINPKKKIAKTTIKTIDPLELATNPKQQTTVNKHHQNHRPTTDIHRNLPQTHNILSHLLLACWTKTKPPKGGICHLWATASPQLLLPLGTNLCHHNLHDLTPPQPANTTSLSHCKLANPLPP